MPTTPSHFDVLYLSPHPDDAVFSTGAAIARDVRAGLRVAVVTVFTRTAEAQEARAAEDEAALARLGAARIALDLPEAPARDRRLRSPGRLFAPVDEVDPLVATITSAVIAIDAAHVVAPLGVGEHADHQLVHLAGARLGATRDVRFYEDLPYAFAEFSVGRRLARLGGSSLRAARGSSLEELRAQWRWWSAMPITRGWGPLRPLALAVLARAGSRRVRASPSVSTACSWSDEPVEVGAQLDDQLAAIACYASQWPLFFPSLEAWRTALVARVERRWRCAPDD